MRDELFELAFEIISVANCNGGVEEAPQGLFAFAAAIVIAK